VVGVVEKPKKVEIAWQNPLDVDFDTVRITRSTTAYPRDPFEGRVVYEGGGNFVIDKNVQEGVKYYLRNFCTRFERELFLRKCFCGWKESCKK
jgi:hypothetical protein